MTDAVLRHAETRWLLDRLYRALDDGDPEALTSCFVPDAVWHRADGPKTGVAAIRTVATDRTPERTTTHVPSNLTVEEDGEGFVARYYLTVYSATAERAASLLACLDCIDHLVATPVGLRVSEKRTRPRMRFG